MKHKRLVIFIIVFLAIVLSLTLLLKDKKSHSALIQNDMELVPNTPLTYTIFVSYDGKDKSEVQSSDNTKADVKSDIITVTDKIPEGLTFTGFATTSNGVISAIDRDTGNACDGTVIDDTNELTNAGVWNAGNTEYTYHGLHYTTSDRIVKFRVKDLNAGCKISVGVITQTPSTVTTRLDFYNFANAYENDFSAISNTTHAFMGSESATLYTVSYSYTGTVPSTAPSAPATQSYAASTTVGVDVSPEVEGYTFSGWSTSDATVSNGSFTMPSTNVAFTGSFTAKTARTITYQITGTAPDKYTAPASQTSYQGAIVYLDSLQAGDIVRGYRFLGWTTSDATITDGYFEMPNSNVTITGSFEPAYTLSYAFYEDVLPPACTSGTNCSTLLPDPVKYASGDEITLSNVKSEPSGYKFLGWYEEETFIMPKHDVVVYGEWKEYAGTFEPTITKTIVDPEELYETGDEVEFAITVTNPAAYTITDVYVKEKVDGVTYLAGTGYTIESTHIAKIASIASGASVTISAKYTVQSSDSGSLENIAEIIGASAANNYELSSNEIKTNVDFTIASKFKVNKTDTNGDPLSGAEFTLYKGKNNSNNNNGFVVSQLKATGSSASSLFEQNISRDQFETINILDTNEVPIEAIDSWDVGTTNSESGAVMAWYLDEDNDNLFELYIGQNGGVVANTGNYLFAYFSNVTAINGLDKLDTSHVSVMQWMFRGCNSLSTLDLSHFDTSQVTTMHGMFMSCTNLSSIIFGNNYNTINLTNTANMFSGCTSLTSLDLSSFYTMNIDYMHEMFRNCSSLTTLDLSNFGTSLTTNMTYMFYNCSSLTTLDISNFDTSKVTQMYYMFYNCGSLTTIYVSELWDVTNATSTSNMFTNCIQLPNYVDTAINKDRAHYNSGGYLTYKASTMPLLFVLLSGSNSSNNVFGNNIDKTLFESISFVNYDDIPVNAIDSWNVSRSTNGLVMAWYTDEDSNSKYELYIGSDNKIVLSSGYNLFYGFKNVISITGFNNLNTSYVTTMYQMFYNCSAVSSLDLSSFNTSNLTNMANMFSGCNELININISSFDTSKVTTMYRLFMNCSKLEVINISNFNTSKVTNMESMFDSCSVLTTLNLSNFETSNLTNMSYMFRSCTNLSNLNISSFNTTNVTTMLELFYGCSSLTTLDLSNFNITNLTSMYRMFCQCTSLITVNLTSFDTSNITNMDALFFNCSSLRNIYVSDLWDITNVTSSTQMFISCSLLPNYSSSDVTATKAHYNSGGYLTYKEYFPFELVSTGLQFNLAPGTVYRLRETKVPSGYESNGVTYEIIVDANGNITVTDYNTTIDQNGYTVLTVQNAKLSILPNTGGPGNKIYTAVGLILMALSVIGTAIYADKEIKKWGAE